MGRMCITPCFLMSSLAPVNLLQGNLRVPHGYCRYHYCCTALKSKSLPMGPLHTRRVCKVPLWENMNSCCCHGTNHMGCMRFFYSLLQLWQLKRRKMLLPFWSHSFKHEKGLQKWWGDFRGFLIHFTRSQKCCLHLILNAIWYFLFHYKN